MNLYGSYPTSFSFIFGHFSTNESNSCKINQTFRVTLYNTDQPKLKQKGSFLLNICIDHSTLLQLQLQDILQVYNMNRLIILRYHEKEILVISSLGYVMS